MAEIPIQEKRRSNLLPLIIGALLLLLLFGWCATRDNDADDGADTAAVVTDTGVVPAPAPIAPPPAVTTPGTVGATTGATGAAVPASPPDTVPRP